MVMASAIAAATFVCSPASAPRGTKSAIYNPSSSLISRPQNPKFGLCSVFPPLGLSPFSPWSGLKHLGISFTPKSLKLERKGRHKGMVVYASLFGVGAPEALVIGVVALLVFGPKGLAEVARNLGKTLRAFQPTIRELQDVSREFKSTLEKEIGLDDISPSAIDTYNANKMATTSTPSSAATTSTPSSAATAATPSSDATTSTPTSTAATSTPTSTATTGDAETTAEPNGAPSPSRAYTSEEYLKITEEQLKAAAAQNQGQTSTPVESQLEPQTPSQATVEETAARTPSTQQPQSEA
ncbi:sec-independent protein translocase protein TATB chloroplastic [Prunus yedoensis var. nudiflora]|uniref:Sec-independent protein translocase protein TATB chloroplastic n=1 Tax=Prunus yedoensis var. nudiflora TaxID=2094558 RepID=A0A314ZGG3_PRUYE|nr:sec-independent protein translocase protein TATB chloroplastic [Prunus yedoensis var. nudiflora]